MFPQSKGHSGIQTMIHISKLYSYYIYFKKKKKKNFFIITVTTVLLKFFSENYASFSTFKYIYNFFEYIFIANNFFSCLILHAYNMFFLVCAVVACWLCKCAWVYFSLLFLHSVRAVLRLMSCVCM